MRHRNSSDWMWAYACDVIAQVEATRRQFLQPIAPPDGVVAWRAPADVAETAEHILVVVALPGVPAQSVEVRLEGRDLVVVGQRRVQVAPDAVLRRLEIPHGCFECRLLLPPGQFEITPWRLVDGCLHLTLTKLG